MAIKGNTFKTFAEYLIAVKNASEGKGIDKRLVRICKKPVMLSEDELMKMEMLADILASKHL